ncbi:hypothetical protein [Paraburkholderia kururiensis]|jgi:uncharacterized protein (DUF3084 family)|uniref:hypothetical protein n=1 Tax=Paraburkholderia kururiensis TaxID=984307 RepID=UPI0018F2D1E4|nr:hypothetical protein [Paraburkholderia kururiensis]
MNRKTRQDSFCPDMGYEAMCSIIAKRIAQLSASIHDELRRGIPDTQRIELLQLQCAELHRIRDTVEVDDARTIARHVAHFGRVVREHGDSPDSVRDIAPSPTAGTGA